MIDPGRKTPADKVPMDHPAGPHAKPELTDDEATPGAGTLPDAPAGDDRDADPGAG
jgi:hypothetical protein